MLRNLNEKKLEVEKILSEKNLEVEKILNEKDAELLKMKKQLADAEKQLRIQTQVSFYYFRAQSYKTFYTFGQIYKPVLKWDNIPFFIYAIVPLNVKAISLNCSTRLLNQPQSTSVL